MELPKRIYVDTNIVSRLVDYRVTTGTASALAALARRSDFVLVTSEKTRGEVLQTTNPKRAGVLELLVTLFEKVRTERLESAGAIGDDAIGVRLDFIDELRDPACRFTTTPQCKSLNLHSEGPAGQPSSGDQGAVFF